MVYLYLGEHTIKLLSLTKTLLGQYNLSHFAKTHPDSLLEAGQIKNVDLTTSVIKEALTSAQPGPVNDKEVILILPQSMFVSARYDIPQDMAEPAILPFVKEKIKTDLKIDMDLDYYDYVIKHHGNETTLFFYSFSQKNHDQIEEVMKLLQLRAVKIIPETLAYFTLFEKTLRKEKKEKILYVSYEKPGSFGYLFDSHGFSDKEAIPLAGDVKTALKKKIEEYKKAEIKINRLILSGTESAAVRQDLFTKDVGVWTNPLEKIIDNFYQEYLKLIASNMNESFSILQYDVCFGAFIFVQENKDFSLLKQAKGSGRFALKLPSVNLGFLGKILSLKTLGIFLVSFAISFGIIFGLSYMKVGSFNLKLPTQKASETKKIAVAPTKTPTPTPAIAREEIKIKIQNGSGTVGKAGEVKEILLDAGYSDIITENADSFDYTASEVQIKKDKKDAFTLLKTDLADYVTLTKSSVLDAEENADVVFIIGTDFE
ncbi:hypothetical protein A3F34_01685 [Candidatus Roizmanbacteria bacterium RIFCSPHIGHO2_12_FULL_44_10]|uniref:LytR/CpsA/Psr regulator C-terminal domain-containing protein n=1 Tax=Candidatus Roizmanbacteria bacterium RIFCSPHIGHO2_12_FULL_44_10 TaxID=1802054 RepID=A0A1F7IB43_9BACT|nr:MAG: hypothetical protein A3F34_01685 [Candidatus Roizmanbacteria bacterium RIFCSPHIGHO2_12_FULL_44_10]